MGSDHLQSPRRTFPYLLVTRWVVGAALVLHGLFGLYLLSQSWAVMADRAIIHADWSPWRYLPPGVLKVATGILLLARSKLVAIALLAWIAAFSYLFLSTLTWSQFPAQLFFSWMEQLAIVGLVGTLWFKGRLR